ncbi:hypothetical protein [Bradyrhizobium prioriisuperbiae]|uniref:hypothetical protein n=1 Tax=Bradyrhizobium prioriisuperbiae TaxID=2854389 RepID=UPI0028E6616D|nr:hypothetical protein [Bradyrhizobium prioritasuperba]
MAVYNKFDIFVENLAEKVHNLQSDTLKIMLVNSLAPVSTNSVKADLTEIAAGNGYPAGGLQVAQSVSAQTSGTYKLVVSDATFTATTASFGPFQYAVLYNDTPTSPLKPLIAWWNYGTAITITAGNSFTVDLDQAGGVFTLA